ncbi:MAG TPA: SDR family NAD(P)-dependent oxidoreductase [Candidatus Acidoferrales bacterium]|nr:SDR family NAD(P)-dependent oxidoreductase [Candidatus Acidoferrales bacterium]
MTAQSDRRGVVVTGASSGIGAAAALALADAGFAVFAGFRSEADGERMAALHKDIEPIHLDVTDTASVKAACTHVLSSGVPLHGLVNNAGIAIGGPVEFLPIEEWRRLFDVNVFGAVATTQIFLPQLRVDGGRIIFIGSISGRLAAPFLAPYSASKFALRAITDALRMEVAPAGVLVSIVEPGSVITPIWSKGRQTRQQMERLLGAQGVALYGSELKDLLRASEEQERIGMPVERVAQAIVHALTARRPKTHYLVGSRLASAASHLPATLRDKHVFGRNPRPK